MKWILLISLLSILILFARCTQLLESGCIDARARGVVTEYKLDDVLLEFTPAAERLSIIESLAQQAKQYVVK